MSERAPQEPQRSRIELSDRPRQPAGRCSPEGRHPQPGQRGGGDAVCGASGIGGGHGGQRRGGFGPILPVGSRAACAAGVAHLTGQLSRNPAIAAKGHLLRSATARRPQREAERAGDGKRIAPSIGAGLASMNTPAP